MIFEIEDIPIYFPYDTIYPEQLSYIKSLLKSLQKPGVILIEMPSGAGKTISLLSCTVSFLIYSRKFNKQHKIVYCSRTLQEIDKVLDELKKLILYIQKYIEFDFLGFGLSKRENLCINPAAKEGNVELICRKMINKLDNLKCDFYENRNFEIPGGVYTFNEIKALGKKNNFCPYFTIREAILKCDCIVYPYNYIIDPSIYTIISEKFQDDCIVIFDEAHNIDSHCIESLSLEINRNLLEAATKVLKNLEEKISTAKQEVKDKLLRTQKITELKDEGIPYWINNKVIDL